jgi:hypothetical protein
MAAALDEDVGDEDEGEVCTAGGAAEDAEAAANELGRPAAAIAARALATTAAAKAVALADVGDTAAATAPSRLAGARTT